MKHRYLVPFENEEQFKLTFDLLWMFFTVVGVGPTMPMGETVDLEERVEDDVLEFFGIVAVG